MTSYTHFTQFDRIMLSALHKKGCTQADIARELGRDQGSVSRELDRNSDEDGTYHAGHARLRATARRDGANDALRRIENDPFLEKYIIKNLKKYWSPEQIAGRFFAEFGQVVCHETIYTYILRHGVLKKFLRCQKGKYRRRYGTEKREKQREKLKKRDIDIRPDIINSRERLGDWEGDTVEGLRGTGFLLTHVDRRSGYTMIERLKRDTAGEVRAATAARFSQIPCEKKLSVTYDNGSEFDCHEFIEKDTHMTVYFAHPYHSWERGTNENTNGLIRQFFPKKTSFAMITKEQTQLAERLLNTRPRKRLGYLTPREVFIHNMHLT